MNVWRTQCLYVLYVLLYFSHVAPKTSITKDDSTNNSPLLGNSSKIEVKNLSVRVFRDRSNDGCRAVTTEKGACPTYEISFSVKNDTTLEIDRVNSIKLDFNNGLPLLDIAFTCNIDPWNIAPGESSGVIDFKISYGV